MTQTQTKALRDLARHRGKLLIGKGYILYVTARALERRGLVTIKSCCVIPGLPWCEHAVLTDAGWAAI